MRRVAGLVLLPLVALALLAALLGGLARLGIAPPSLRPLPAFTAAMLHHAALMICAFMGTVIAIERAVALKRPFAWSAPFASGAAGAALLGGQTSLAAGLLVLAAASFFFVNLALLRKQRAEHTWLLLASSVAWLVGNACFAAGLPAYAVLPWWFAFLLVTIAAERLEMTRLMRRRPGAHASLYAVLALLALASACSAVEPVAGGVLYGVALVLLAAWLLTFDIARRTLHADGLARYMAVCLLGGYLWLAVAGIAWAATALGLPVRDVALHGLGLGFVLSMMMGHAPVILPAVAGFKVLFGPWYYAPLALLHLSLLLRFLQAPATGALFNALAIAMFALTLAGSALAWRRRHPPLATALGKS
jgi:hypothetical protein